MSRLASMSPEALRSLFSPDSDSTLIALLTITYGYDGLTPLQLRLADNYTGRLTNLTTDDEVFYGVTSRNTEYIFLPFSLTLPQEQEDQAPSCSLELYDVTQYLTEIIREQFEIVPRVKLELVLSKTPNTVEATFTGFYISSFSYTADSVTADLSMVDYEREPFPMHSFTPAYFPGMF